jgi:hypothetical protein
MKVAEQLGIDLPAIVDACGGILWGATIDDVEGTFELIAQADGLLEIDPKVRPVGFKERKHAEPPHRFFKKIEFDTEHYLILDAVNEFGYTAADPVAGCYSAHTKAIEMAHDTLDLAGEFKTASEAGALNEPNCSIWPGESGLLTVVRYGDAKEPGWGLTRNGRSYTTLNATQTLSILKEGYCGKPGPHIPRIQVS